MARARTAENSAHEGDVRGAASAAPRSNPLELVEAAVAGDDLQSVARSAAEALRCPIAIVLPPFGLTAQWPDAGDHQILTAVHDHAATLLMDQPSAVPAGVTNAIPVRLGHELVGVVAALGEPAADTDPQPWLEAAAAAAAIAALMRDSAASGADSARKAFLQVLELHTPPDPEAVLTQARRLDYDFTAGAIAVGGAWEGEHEPDLRALTALGLIAYMGDGRVLGVAPLGGDAADGASIELRQRLSALGVSQVLISAPRRGASGVREALHEAAVLLELALDPDAMLPIYEETYRLLIGILIRNPDELTQLRDSTIAQLERYDESHDTDLIATLDTFLIHHGSTTDTAEAMNLHRHTVGYRLARVQEVSGLSPYESEGRERLSLGLKAHRIMLAENRRSSRVEPS